MVIIPLFLPSDSASGPAPLWLEIFAGIVSAFCLAVIAFVVWDTLR